MGVYMGYLVIPVSEPINGINFLVGEDTDKYFHYFGNGASGKEGCIYVLAQSIIIIAVLQRMI